MIIVFWGLNNAHTLELDSIRHNVYCVLLMLLGPMFLANNIGLGDVGVQMVSMLELIIVTR